MVSFALNLGFTFHIAVTRRRSANATDQRSAAKFAALCSQAKTRYCGAGATVGFGLAFGFGFVLADNASSSSAVLSAAETASSVT